MNQREFEKAVEEAKIKADLLIQEAISAFLGKRAMRKEEIGEFNGSQESQSQIGR